MENTAVEGNTAASAVGGIDVRNGASVTIPASAEKRMKTDWPTGSGSLTAVQ